MDKFSIEGPSRIRGEVKISGSKNSSLPILAATLLFNQPVVLKNLPKVNDINTMISLLRSLGSKIILSKDKQIVLPLDTVLTVVEPLDSLKQMYEEKSKTFKMEETLND